MFARWATFAVGLTLLLAPLVAGYASVAPILHDVAMGSLVCIAALASLEWPRARFALVAPGLWLAAFAPPGSEPTAAAVDAVAGALLLVLAAIPSARFARRAHAVPAGTGRAGASA